ncbi:MAG: hypothetical protein LBK76_10825 [Verrucomicrobiales bacterium]|jgi:hypothetical protein|nr:hypothetical protein [Verrucomicrobiales bacterium]
MKTLYVRLMDEGTEVFRPTEAELLSDGCFKLLPIEGYDPDDENWEFPPGSIVRAIERKLDGEKALIAVRVDYDGDKNELSV